MPLSTDWDEFLVGLTSTLFVENQTFSFSNQVGFVIGLTKNRRNTLLVADSPLILTTSTNSKFSFDAVMQEAFMLDEAAFEAAMNLISEFFQLDMDMWNELLPFTPCDASSSLQVLSVDKNEWTHEVDACKQLQDEPFTS